MKPILKSNIFIAMLWIITFSSCTDLDETLFSDITTENYEYIQKNALSVIGPIYQKTLSLYGHHKANFCLQEITTDEIAMPANASGWFTGGIWQRMDQHKWSTEEEQLVRVWPILWSGVILANQIIESIEQKMTFDNESQKQSLLAEVRTARAFYYWLLLDNWGEVPIVTQVTNEYPAKKTKSEVYQFVVDELIEVIPDLNESIGNDMHCRFNKWAGKTLLANVYLNAEIYTGQDEWDKCIEQCNEIINSGKYTMEGTYDDIFGQNRLESSEMILGIQYDDVRATSWILHKASFHDGARPKYQMQSGFWGAGAIKAVPQFIDTYDSADLRLYDTWAMGLQLTQDGDTCRCTYEKAGEPLIFTKDMKDGIYTYENEGYRMAKFDLYLGIAAGGLTTTFPLFRYAGVLMMKAECLLRTGKAGEAATIVTNVRKRAFEDPAKANVSASELQEDTRYNYGYVENYLIVDPGNTDPVEYGRMLDELGWEFALESHRRRDMIRFGVYTTKSWLSHKPNGDYRSFFPIPEEVVNANPNLEQNPNY